MISNAVTRIAISASVEVVSVMGITAQVVGHELSWDAPLEVLRTLEREVERGHCSWASAEALSLIHI